MENLVIKTYSYHPQNSRPGLLDCRFKNRYSTTSILPNRFPFVFSMNRSIHLLICFLGLLVFSFSLWADETKDFFINGKLVPKIIASVNGTAIASDFLVNEIKVWKMAAERQGKQPTTYEEEAFARRQIDEAIGHELLFQKSRELKILISTDTIQKEIKNIQKKFPRPEMFLSALAFQRLTIDKLAVKIEKQLTEEAFLRRKIAPNVNVPTSQVKAYYQKNKSQYKTEVSYRVSHIFVATVTADDGEPEDPRDREKARRMIKMINREAQTKIRDILNKLNRGEDFHQLSKTESEDEATRDKGGDMGEIKLSETLPSLASVIAALNVGQISDVVKSLYGYHILKVIGKIPEKQLSFQVVQSDILNIILKEELDKQRLKYLTQLKKTADIKVFL